MFAWDKSSKRRTPSWLMSKSIVALGLMWASPAFAYRPFDGTDAAVAAPEREGIPDSSPRDGVGCGFRTAAKAREIAAVSLDAAGVACCPPVV